MNGKHFSKPFTQQEAIPETGIEKAVEVLRSGRLHRYNALAGETSEAAQAQMAKMPGGFPGMGGGSLPPGLSGFGKKK